MTIRFDNRVVLVTGAGTGLGRAHALMFAERGASVLVNDLGKGADGSSRPADAVVAEIRARGGTAVANYDSVEAGSKIVDSTMDAFGRLDVVVNNAGILRDKSFVNMSDEDWDQIYRVHVYGVFKVLHAAWPQLRSQGYGRIVNTASAAIYGNFGQVNYSAAKSALLGLTRSLAIEGAKHGIKANLIMPLANSQLLETIASKEICAKLDAKCIAALVLKLCAEQSTDTSGIYEVGGGWISQVRFQRSEGAVLQGDDAFDPDAIAGAWADVTNFDRADYPHAPLDSIQRVFEGIGLDTRGMSFGKGFVKLK